MMRELQKDEEIEIQLRIGEALKLISADLLMIGRELQEIKSILSSMRSELSR